MGINLDQNWTDELMNVVASLSRSTLSLLPLNDNNASYDIFTHNIKNAGA